MLLCSFGVNAFFIEKNMKQNVESQIIYEINTIRDTHTVLGEFGTASWCAYCKYAHGALKELYEEGQLDFLYVSHVCDKNSISNNHCANDYNLYGYPTLWWDGGYKIDVGAGSVENSKIKYTSSIKSCSARSVKDVDINLNVNWLGGTELQVDCIILNNENNIYNGTIRVFICEKESSMGWKDSGGQLYTMPFLDWAFNEPLSIPGGSFWSDSMTWDGSSHGYSSITKYNIIIVGAVFNDEWYQGYSNPPSGNPFDAYYVDECVSVDLVTGDPPDQPIINGPLSGNVGVSYDYYVSAIDPDSDDVYYNVDWGDGTTYGWVGPYPSGMNVSIEKIWGHPDLFKVKVIAKDLWSLKSNWSDPIFVLIENIAPNEPIIDGPLYGKPGTIYSYHFQSIDPDGDDVKFFIDWGDDIVEWTDFYNSGVDVEVKHIWIDKGIYIIRAKARDINGAESEWAEFEVSMSRDKSISSSPLLRFLERYPLLNLLLQRLNVL